jgi:hypothetical protein
MLSGSLPGSATLRFKPYLQGRMVYQPRDTCVFLPFHEVPAFRGVRGRDPCHLFDPDNDIGSLAECAELQPAQES